MEKQRELKCGTTADLLGTIRYMYAKFPHMFARIKNMSEKVAGTILMTQDMSTVFADMSAMVLDTFGRDLDMSASVCLTNYL